MLCVCVCVFLISATVECPDLDNWLFIPSIHRVTTFIHIQYKFIRSEHRGRRADYGSVSPQITWIMNT